MGPDCGVRRFQFNIDFHPTGRHGNSPTAGDTGRPWQFVHTPAQAGQARAALRLEDNEPLRRCHVTMFFRDAPTRCLQRIGDPLGKSSSG